MRKKLLIVIVLVMTLLVSACNLTTSKNSDELKIASVVTTEGQILAYMMKYMIEHYSDEKVEIINNLGSSTVVHQAMVNGDANISAVRYTGTDLTGALQAEPIKDPEKALAFVQQAFADRFQQTFFDSYGFENTYAFMVSRETANKYNLKKLVI